MQEQTMLQQPAAGFDPAFVITHSGRVGSTIQHSAAAAFFAKKQPGRAAEAGGGQRGGEGRQGQDGGEVEGGLLPARPPRPLILAVLHAPG